MDARTSKLVNLFVALWVTSGSSLIFAQEKPLIKVVATGGTIAHIADDSRLGFEQVMADIRQRFPETRPMLDKVKIEVDNTLSVGSGSLTSNDVLQIARNVKKAADDPSVKGVIVTHGTVTSEETAYYLHLLIRTTKPIVLTNSQRLHGIVGNDGDRNFIDSIQVVLSPDAVGKGVLLVHNQTISSAREVIKTSGRPGAFLSGDFGILGVIGTEQIIRSNGVSFYRAPTRRHTSRSEFDLDSITSLPQVEVIVAHRNAVPKLAQVAVDMGAKGIVILGTTPSGSPNAAQRPVMEALVEKGIPVVLTTRGGVNNWLEPLSTDKFISGDNLPTQKARILLELALTKTTDFKEIQRIFNEY
ncbi:MAG: asparaginase [Acidobacteria bacterium]|nr:asparaginase [Acidobacteriota bacterium]